jgi:presenilin 1
MLFLLSFKTEFILRSSSKLSEKPPLDIDYWSRSFLALVYPVSFTVIISACLAIFLYDLYTQSNVFEDAGLISSSKGPNAASISKITWESFLIALIIIGIIALATCLLVIFVYYNCIKFLYIYLLFTVICVFSLLNISILSMIIAQLNSSIDWLTILFYIYNILTIAIISMFWLSPDIIKQIVTIYQCIIMILYVLKIAPEWIAWALLPLLAIWDMIAVLLPFGPLYLLINLFQKRKIQVPPMMIYTTGLWFKNQNMNRKNFLRRKYFILSEQWSSLNLIFMSMNTFNYFYKQKTNFNMIKNTNASSDKELTKKNQTRKSMLGLGDFIFYSILLCKTVFTSQCNLFAIIIIYLCIIMGMLATTIILIILHRPLPALPISLLIGLVVFFQYNHIGNRFADALRLPTGPIII